MSKFFAGRLTRRATRSLMALSVVTGTAGLAIVLTASQPASADPGFTQALVGVGSDVTQDVYAGFEGLSPQPGVGTQTPVSFPQLLSSAATDSIGIASFDAYPPGGTTTNPGCIISKTGGPSFDRPNSSTAGINALLAATNGTGWENSSDSCTGATVNVTGEINFARSARGPNSTGSTLTFIPFARDALGILVWEDGDTGNLSSLTTAQLTSLYTGSTGTITVGGKTVYGCLTISGSVPRSQLEKALGITDSQANTAATAAGCPSISQNSGNAFQTFYDTLPSGSEAIIPISAGSWIGQNNQVGVDRSNGARSDGDYLTSITISGSSPVDLGQPYSGSGTSEVPSTTYYENTSWGYNIYTVVATSSISGFGANAALESLFVGSSSAACATSELNNVVHDFGFDSLTSSEGTCGSGTTGDS